MTLRWPWRGRSGSRPERRPLAPRILPDVGIDVQVEEAELIASAGARLSLKNLFILRTLRDGKSFEESWYATAVQEELLHLANETDRDADRMLDERQRALRRQGRAMFQDDYRLIDAELLDRREKVLRGLAARLRSLSADRSYILALIGEAREQALDEVVAAVAQAPREADSSEPESMMLHQERLAALHADLDELLASGRR